MSHPPYKLTPISNGYYLFENGYWIERYKEETLLLYYENQHPDCTEYELLCALPAYIRFGKFDDFDD